MSAMVATRAWPFVARSPIVGHSCARRDESRTSIRVDPTGELNMINTIEPIYVINISRMRLAVAHKIGAYQMTR